MAKKASSKEPFLPLFFGDFLAATAEWEGEERALYLLLLGYQWSLGSLPVEPRKLCKLVGWSESLFEQCWPTVSAKFFQQGTRLLNHRLEQHRAKTHELSQKNSASGKKGAATRWHKDGERHTENMASAIQNNGERHAERYSGEDGERHKNGRRTLQKRHPKTNGVTDSNPSHPILSHPSEQPSSAAHTSPQGETDADAPPADEMNSRRERKFSPEAAIAIPLRDRGVQVTSQSPELLGWVRDGFTPQQCIDAVGIARIRKPHPQPIPAGYLDTILRDPKHQPGAEQPARKTRFERAMEDLHRE